MKMFKKVCKSWESEVVYSVAEFKETEQEKAHTLKMIEEYYNVFAVTGRYKGCNSNNDNSYNMQYFRLIKTDDRFCFCQNSNFCKKNCSTSLLKHQNEVRKSTFQFNLVPSKMQIGHRNTANTKFSYIFLDLELVKNYTTRE